MRAKYRLEKSMKKLLTVFTLLLSAVTISVSGCSEKEPILPDEVAREIKNNLGYALAPAWLPKGYEYCGPYYTNKIVADRASTLKAMQQPVLICYGKDASRAIGNSMIMSYPTEDTIPSVFQEMVDLIPPEDAITETEINGNTAYLYQGNWSEETLGRVAKLEEPFDPEWDYDRSIAIRFLIDVPGEGNIWVSISTIFSVEDITQKDLVKIAKSVTVID